MIQKRLLALMLLMALCLALFIGCNGDAPTPAPDGGDDGGVTPAPDAPSSLNEYGDNIVDYDSLFGGEAE